MKETLHWTNKGLLYNDTPEPFDYVIFKEILQPPRGRLEAIVVRVERQKILWKLNLYRVIYYSTKCTSQHKPILCFTLKTALSFKDDILRRPGEYGIDL